MFFAHTDAANIIRREIGLSSSFAMLPYLPRGLLRLVAVQLPIFSGIGVLIRIRGGGEHSATPGTFCVSESSNKK